MMDREKKNPTTLEEHVLTELYDARKMVEDLGRLLEDAKSKLRFVLGFLNELELMRIETPKIPAPDYYEFWFTSKDFKRKPNEEETDVDFAYRKIKKLIEREFGK